MKKTFEILAREMVHADCFISIAFPMGMDCDVISVIARYRSGGQRFFAARKTLEAAAAEISNEIQAHWMKLAS